MGCVMNPDRRVTLATTHDLNFVTDLATKHADAVGFLTRTALDAYVRRQRVTIAHENGDPCGYFLTGADASSIRIFQAAVHQDAQGLRHGIDLLGGVIIRAAAIGASRITLHCRDGLASNGFWSACGFESRGLIFGGGSRRRLVHSWALNVRDAVRNPSLPYARRLLESLTRGTPPGKISPQERTPESCYA